MDPIVAYLGIRFTIEYAICSDGSIPARDFYDGLEERRQARLVILFKFLGDTGQIRNTEHFRRFVDDIFEFKAYQMRMPCYFRPDRRVVITHGFASKRGSTTLKQERARAKRIKYEYEERLTSGEEREGTGGKNNDAKIYIRAVRGEH